MRVHALPGQAGEGLTWQAGEGLDQPRDALAAHLVRVGGEGWGVLGLGLGYKPRVVRR